MASTSGVIPVDALEYPYASAEVDRELRIREAPSTVLSTSSEKTSSEKTVTAVSVEEDDNPLTVVGSTQIISEEGNVRLIPSPTPDPKDPLNLPNWRKYVAIGCLCFFGSLSLCTEMMISGLLPVFILEYSGVDPKAILPTADLKDHPSPLAVVPKGVVPVDLYKVTLLSTLPSLSNCVVSYLLVPLSLAIGRRPVLLVAAMCSWIGGFWAGYSTTLQTHLYARVLHGIGTATAEGLLPLIMQDFVFIHQRNRAIAAILACQGPLMAVFGVVSPYVAIHYSWRWLYWITAIGGVVAWILCILFVPETRKVRSKQELNGIQLWPIPPGKNRPDLDYAKYGKRTWKDDVGMFTFGYHWKETGVQILRTLQSTYFPAVVLVIMLDVGFMIVLQTTGQNISFALLAAGVPFELSGLHVLTSLFSSIFVYIFGGPLADKLTLKVSKMRGRHGAREPEFQLLNLCVPVVLAMTGAAIFGVSQNRHWHFATLLLGSFLMGIGTLTVATIAKVFVLESYPQWPGPVLVNVTTYRTLISFFVSSHATQWLQEIGALRLFGIYIGMLAIISLNIPVFFFYGKKFREWTSGTLSKKTPLNRVNSSETMTTGTEIQSLNKVMSMETMGSVEKDKTLTRVMSTETIATTNSIDKRLS